MYTKFFNENMKKAKKSVAKAKTYKVEQFLKLVRSW